MLYITTKLSINYQNSIIKGILYQFVIEICIKHKKRDSRRSLFCIDNYQIEFVVKVCTVEVRFVVTVLVFPVETVVSGQANVVLQCVVNSCHPTFSISSVDVVPSSIYDWSISFCIEVLTFYAPSTLFFDVVVTETNACSPSLRFVYV